MFRFSVVFVVNENVTHRDLHVLNHSFPTRRSSDRPCDRRTRSARTRGGADPACPRSTARGSAGPAARSPRARVRVRASPVRDRHPVRAGRARGGGAPRSEEHTSELQSLMRNSYAVFCLKKKNITEHTLTHNH